MQRLERLLLDEKGDLQELEDRLVDDAGDDELGLDRVHQGADAHRAARRPCRPKSALLALLALRTPPAAHTGRPSGAGG